MRDRPRVHGERRNGGGGAPVCTEKMARDRFAIRFAITAIERGCQGEEHDEGKKREGGQATKPAR